MRQTYLLLLCFFLLLSVQIPVLGGTVVDSYVKTYVFYCFDTSDCTGANAHYPAADGPHATAPSSVSTSGTLTSGTDSAVFSYSGAAWTNYGSFGVYSYGHLTGGDTSLTYSTDALAQFGEKLTISDPAKTGQSGTFAASVMVNGSMTGAARANIVLIDPANGVSGESIVLNGPATINFQPVSFVYGTPFDLTFQFFATVHTPGVTSFTGSGNFADTATLTGLQVYDQDSIPDPNATFMSGSGTQYSAAGVVPEPSTWLLIFVGLGGLAAARRRR